MSIDFDRFTDEDFIRLVIRCLNEMSSAAIEEVIQRCGTDEFNTIADAVDRRKEKED